MKKPLATLIVAAFVLACGEDSPTTVDDLQANLAVAGASGCYTVAFTLANVPAGPTTFAGVVTGDLQGTAVSQFDVPGIGFTGVTIGPLTGTIAWDITGGIMPPLQFVTGFTLRNVVDVNQGVPDFNVATNIGSLRALSGVEKANLTFIGGTDFSQVPSTVIDVHGVICP